MTPSELETRILRLLDGELPPAEAAELEAVLLADEAARATYEEFVLLHNALESRFAASQEIVQMGLLPKARFVGDPPRRPGRYSGIAAAASLAISAVTMWSILAPRAAVEVASLRTTPGAVLSVSHDGEGEAPEGGQLAVGSVVDLTEGTLEGTFKSGVRMVAEAPCRLKILTEDSVALERGKAWFRVPQPAAGFNVRTADMMVVDLGTEFGMVATTGEAHEIHLLQGSVEVSSLLGKAGRATLSAPAARRLEGDGSFQKIEPNASIFETELRQSREVTIRNHSFEEDLIARDGSRSTKESGVDDYIRDLVPVGWADFSEPRGMVAPGWGIASTAGDSFFGEILAPTPDDDANDQAYFSGERDICQIVTERLQPNTTYKLSVDVGDWLAEKGYDGAPGRPEIRLGTGSNAGEGLLTPKTTHFPEQIDGGWVRWTATYETGPAPPQAGEPLRVELIGAGRMSWYDRVRLQAVSPATR